MITEIEMVCISSSSVRLGASVTSKVLPTLTYYYILLVTACFMSSCPCPLPSACHRDPRLSITPLLSCRPFLFHRPRISPGSQGHTTNPLPSSSGARQQCTHAHRHLRAHPSVQHDWGAHRHRNIHMHTCTHKVFSFIAS